MTRSSALPSSSRSGTPRRFLPHPVPMLFVAAFLVVIAVNGALIFFAEDTFSGLETQQAYEHGLNYNKALSAEAAQERLGWQSRATISTGADGRHTLRVQLMDRGGGPLDDLTLEAYLIRPSNDGMDMSIVPRPAGGGVYVAEFALPAPGQWELRLVAHRGDLAWQQSDRLFVKR
jgi:nitrogen fixation protein FixH